MRSSSVVAVLTAAATVMAWGCSRTDERLGVEMPQPPAQFGTPDAGPDATPDPRELVAYCPSSQCPPGWTTCPDSRFPCDTNILADSTNCGGCGLACPPGGTCSEGACVLQCEAGLNKDCDGLVDNGCESALLDPKNCGACGVVCDEAAEEYCNYQDDARSEIGCGCPPGKVQCGGECKDLSANDLNCGTCNKPCDLTEAPDHPNMYYGCLASECGKLKCAGGFANCDGNLGNGCETSILSDDNCGACGNKCSAGERCAVDDRGNPKCMCGQGLTFCQQGEMYGLPQGYCTDLSTSTKNCGACGVDCGSIAGGDDWVPVCDFGKCVLTCSEGTADCNGAASDGCEIDTRSDPRHCGGCGITCDLALGQACVAGRCVVEPCDRADAGEVTR